MTCAGSSLVRILVLPVADRTASIAEEGKVLVITPKLMKSVIRVPCGSSATVLAIVAPPVEFPTGYHKKFYK
jgi:hypothetical protein